MIRHATMGDATLLAEIMNPVIRDTTVTFTSAQKTVDDIVGMIENQAFLLWSEDGEVLGFATYFPFRRGDGYRHTAEHTIVLQPAARGRGIGRALMTALLVEAANDDIHSMIAGISAENTGAVGFHDALGFAKVAVLPQVGFKFGRWIDLVLMQKML